MRQGSRGRGVEGQKREDRVRGVKGSRSQGSEKNFEKRFTLHASRFSPFTFHLSPFTNKGFTLIELIIFIIIAGIFLPATYVAFSSAMKQGTQPEDYTRGMLLTEQVMELATKRGYTQLLSDVSSPPSCATVIGISVPAGYSCTFTPSLITSVGGLSLSANNYIQIFVSVTTPQSNTFSSTGMVTNHGF